MVNMFKTCRRVLVTSLCRLSPQTQLKQHAFILSSFLDLRGPGVAQLGPLLQSPSEAAVTASARAGLPSEVLGAVAELLWLAEFSSGVAGARP